MLRILNCSKIGRVVATMLTTAATILTTGVALLLPYGEFVTNPWDIFALPYQRLSEIDLSREIPLSAQLEGARPLGQCREGMPKNLNVADASPVTESVGTTEVLYLFLLDISGSINRSIPTPRWLLDANYRINEYMNQKVFGITLDEVTIFDLAKIRLGDLLVGIGPKNDGPHPSREKFALWDMGTNPAPLFPPKESPTTEKKAVPITKNTIEDALNALENAQNNENNKDFVTAIREFKNSYPDYFPENPDRAKDRVVVITILSDFIHNIDDREYYRNRATEIEEDWSALEKEIRDHSHANVVANLMVLTKSDRVEQSRFATHRQIAQLYKQHFPPSKFSINAITEKAQNHLLYPPMCSRKPIEFYYQGQRFIGDVTLKIDARGEREESGRFGLTVAIPKTVDDREQPLINLYWGLLPNMDVTPEMRHPKDVGWIGSNGETFSDDKLLPKEGLLLTPLGYPSQLKDQKTVSALFISPALRRVYHMDIQFTKIMPKWYAWLVLILQILFVIFVLGTLLCPLVWWIAKYIPRKKAVDKDRSGSSPPQPKALSSTESTVPGSGDIIAKIEPNDLEGAWESGVDWLLFKPGKSYSRSPFDQGTPTERGSYLITHHDGKTFLRLSGVLEGPVYNPPVLTDWEIVHWDKHELHLVQSESGQKIHYKRQAG